MRLGTWERAASFASWVNGERALAAFPVGTAAEAPADLVYKQIELPPEELTYYELVSRAEVLRSARIDDSDLDRAILTLLPEHSEQSARVEAIALAEGSEDEGE